MERFPRALNLPAALARKSAFLFGPRGTGKTTLVAEQLGNVRTYDLLDQRVYLRLVRDATLLEQENPTPHSLIVIDEIQKLPDLLDEAHRLIVAKQHRFLLTGSSARKLKRQGVNLLGGRARELHLAPLTYAEIGTTHFDLTRYLNRGGLPEIYLSDDPADDLRGYIGLYLREEVAAEALVRRVDQFARFLDVLALCNGEELHLENIASDAGVKARTVANYVEILEDTLLGRRVPPYRRTRSRKASGRPKFYFFDVGVAAALARRGPVAPGSELFGRAFEHLVAMEIVAALAIRRSDLELTTWRQRAGLEVDFVVGDAVAIEVKATTQVDARHLRGLRALRDEASIRHFVVVSRDPSERVIDGIHILPWAQAFQALRDGLWF